MNVNPKTLMRTVAIAVLLAVGFATTLTSCGDGSSSSTRPPDPPPATLLVIHADNAFDVSSELMTAIVMSFDIGELTGGDIVGQPAAGAAELKKILRNDRLMAMVGVAAEIVPTVCPNGGTVTVTMTLADPNTLTLGDQIDAVFDNCDEGDGYVLDGQLSLTIAAIQGDIMTQVFLLGLDMTMTDMSITEGTETVVANADMTLTLDMLNFPVLVQTIEGAELSMASTTESLTFTNFEHVFQVDIGVVPESIVVTVSGRLDSAHWGGAIDYATTTALQAIGDNYPYVGRILITGDGSSVRIVINNSNSVTLEVDIDDDGVIDEFIDTTFAALIGDSSMINGANALAIAQEVTHAGTGFGHLAKLPGRQFFDLEPFGQVKELAVSGNFGPLEFACGGGGTAAVSGVVANAGTYTADDSLSAVFSGCGGFSSDLYTGQVDIVVSSFTQEQDESPESTSPFHFIGTVTATSLESVTPNSTHIGSGTFEIDYELLGFALEGSASSASFSVAHGDVNNTLSDASVAFASAIDFGNRISYAGQLVSDRFDSTCSFESVSPYVWYSDSSPFVGELLITTDDSSSVRIVIVDEFSIRLDVDYEGDMQVDETITTTWAELLQSAAYLQSP